MRRRRARGASVRCGRTFAPSSRPSPARNWPEWMRSATGGWRSESDDDLRRTVSTVPALACTGADRSQRRTSMTSCAGAMAGPLLVPDLARRDTFAMRDAAEARSLGLTEEEASARLARDGPNELPPPRAGPRPSRAPRRPADPLLRDHAVGRRRAGPRRRPARSWAWPSSRSSSSTPCSPSCRRAGPTVPRSAYGRCCLGA